MYFYYLKQPFEIIPQ